jgi:hypothetical protein
MRKIVHAALAALALCGLAGTAEAKRLAPEEKLAKMLDGRVAGEPSDCIYTPSIRSTTVIAKTAIVYDAGSILWLNPPKTGASSLDDDDILVTDLHSAQLCSIDIVRLHDRSTHFYDGFVGLDKFVPYRKPSARN